MAKQTFTTGQVLTAAQMTSLQQTAMGGGAATAKTASYVLVAADAGTTVAMNAAGATTITVNTGLFAAGDTVFIQNLGAGACTVTAGTATVATAGSLILPQNDAGILYFTSASAAIFYDYIQAGAVSPLTTKGDLYTFSTSDARLGVGANGTTLVADSAEATGLKWASPASGGGMTLLSTTTLSGAGTVDISGISQDYIELRVYMYNVVVNTNAIYTVKTFNGASELSSVVGWRMSNYSTPSYASGSSFRLTSDDAGNQSVAGSESTNFWALTYYDYSSTANYKNYLYLGNYKNTSSAQVAWHSFGAVESNSAINKLQFTTTAGAFTAGTVEIYGVK